MNPNDRSGGSRGLMVREVAGSSLGPAGIVGGGGGGGGECNE